MNDAAHIHARPQRLLRRVEDQIGAHRSRHAPAAKIRPRITYCYGVTTLPKPNYAFEKRQRDIAKLKKREAKQKKKAEQDEKGQAPDGAEPHLQEKEHTSSSTR